MMPESLQQFTDTFWFTYVVLPILIFLARIIDVTLGTFRISLISKGQKLLPPLIGFIEILVWVLAIGKIIQDLDNWVSIIAYAAGYGTGNFIGMRIEEKIAMGIVQIQVITTKAANDLITKLKAKGYGITHHEAFGANGKVSILYTIVSRADIPVVVEMIRTYNPKAFYSIEDVKFVNKGVDTSFYSKYRNRKGK